MIPEPVLDGRRVESLVQELHRFAPHYTPDLNLADAQGAGPALMRIFAHLAETVLVRLGRTPQKHFVAFLARLGIGLLPARPARAPVTFRLASGLDAPVRVPGGARVTAQGEEDEIPFETTEELLVIPGALVAAYGVDPEADAIYPHPPGFLAPEIRAATELVYQLQTFVVAGARRLQLDHVTELAPGSFLRIGAGEKVVVASVAEGNIVTLADPLGRDMDAGTLATPIRDFEPFDGIDVQAHVLYLGHADLFTVEQEATVTLDIRLVPNQPGLTPFDVVWQFRTDIGKDTPEAREDWYDFEVVSDGTAGFSSSGGLVLHKPGELEIKEVTVGGVKSRWIRAALRDKLPADGRPLPEVDTITIAVRSGPPDLELTDQSGLLADQGFHNVTPLDLQVAESVGFFPFGTEPRQFDQFYVASAEAFSKREATVHLDFTLDLQTLAAPSLVRAGGGVRAYSIGLRRRLSELQMPGGSWTVLGSPADQPQGAGFLPLEDAVPSTVTDATGSLIYTFVNSEDTRATDPARRANKIWVHFHAAAGGAGAWIDLDAPDAGGGARQALFNPAAVVLPAGAGAFARVFIVGADGRLYSRDITTAPAPSAAWQKHDLPAGESWLASSSPFVTTVGSDVLVFVTGDDGLVHWLTLSGAGPVWAALAPNNHSFKAVSRPFAQGFGPPANAKVFVFGQQPAGAWKLFECDTRDVDGNGEFTWHDFGRPFANDGIAEDPDAHAPAGYVEDPAEDIAVENKHIFLRGPDGRLYERLDEEIENGDGGWQDRTRPGDPPLRDSPAVLVEAAAPVTLVHVVSASGRNSLVTWDLEILRVATPADPQGRSVLFDPGKASSRDGEYVGRDLTVTKPATPSETKAITGYDGLLRLARLDAALSFVPDSTCDCSVDVDGTAVDVGPAGDDTDTLFAIHAPAADTRAAQPIYVRVAGDLVDFNFYSRIAGVVSLDAADQPATNDEVAVYLQVFPARAEFRAAEDTSTVPELSWEYWNGRGWLSLAVSDGTRNLLQHGLVTFVVPESIEPTEVAGQNNFWIRARLVGGDYGRETFKIVNDTVVSEKSTLRPPKVNRLRIYYLAPPVQPAVCLAFNNLDYLDQTAACLIGGAHFRPFDRLEHFEDRSLTVFFGFDKPFRTGPVRLLIDAAEREFDESRPPALDWRYRKDRQWKDLLPEDGTVALTRQGILSLFASDELTRESRFGVSLYWIRGSLRTDRGSSGAAYPRPLLRGIFPNTVWALQGETITDEILGSSDGEPNQTHTLQNADVLEGEEEDGNEDIRVREFLSAEEQERIERESGTDSVRIREDIGGAWVRWRETLGLFDAGPDDRCYLIDRAAGLVQFGDGTHGKIPPAGVDNLRAFSYRTGGGAAGNVAAGRIEALGTAVAGIESVFNPTPAGGGSDKATTDAMLTIGPRRISHRDRAVSAEDFEELAQEASRQVAKVRCLGAVNLARRGAGRPDPCDQAQRHEALPAAGWVSLIVVPHSEDARPCPSLELRRTIKDFLLRRVPGVLAAGDRIVIRPPDYVEIGVDADIVVTSLDRAAEAESVARTTLEALLHPLRGGPDGNGWEFGRFIWKSDVFAALERIEAIDRVENLRFRFGGRTDPDRVVIGPNELPASGRHVLNVRRA